MKIAIASDHGGFEMKQALIEYFSKKGLALQDLGILICGTGVGISIAANRHKGIRAALLYNKFVAAKAKEHNNANIIVFGGRTMSIPEVIEYCEIFLKSTYEGGRHQQRLDKMDKGE